MAKAILVFVGGLFVILGVVFLFAQVEEVPLWVGWLFLGVGLVLLLWVVSRPAKTRPKIRVVDLTGLSDEQLRLLEKDLRIIRRVQ